MAVLSELEKLGIKPLLVELGEIELADQISDNEKSMLSTRLQLLGFELIDDKKSQIIERIKTLIIDLVHNRDNDLKTNLSVFIAADLALKGKLTN